jgi:DNA-binding MarR family transcriptional regulator
MDVSQPVGATQLSESEALAAGRLRVAVGTLSRRLRPTVAGSGLTPSEISVLFTIVRLGPLGLSELAEIEALNPTMLSRITAGLCEGGLIRRERRSDDRRAAVVSATAEGKRLRERVQRERTRALSAYLELLDPVARDRLWEALPVLEELVERIKEGPR